MTTDDHTTTAWEPPPPDATAPGWDHPDKSWDRPLPDGWNQPPVLKDNGDGTFSPRDDDPRVRQPFPPAPRPEPTPPWNDDLIRALAEGSRWMQLHPDYGSLPGPSDGLDTRSLWREDGANAAQARSAIARAGYARAQLILAAAQTEALGKLVTAVTRNTDLLDETLTEIHRTVNAAELGTHLGIITGQLVNAGMAQDRTADLLDKLTTAVVEANQRGKDRQARAEALDTTAPPPWFDKPLRAVLRLFGVHIRYVGQRELEDRA